MFGLNDMGMDPNMLELGQLLAGNPEAAAATLASQGIGPSQVMGGQMPGLGGPSPVPNVMPGMGSGGMPGSIGGGMMPSLAQPPIAAPGAIGGGGLPPTAEPTVGPAPMPIGGPGAAPMMGGPAGGMSSIAKTLQGVKAPPAPPPLRAGTPAAPRPSNQIRGGELMAMLQALGMGGGGMPSLGSSLR